MRVAIIRKSWPFSWPATFRKKVASRPAPLPDVGKGRGGGGGSSSMSLSMRCASCTGTLDEKLCGGVDVDAEKFGGHAQLFGRVARSCRLRGGGPVTCGLVVHGPRACFGRRRAASHVARCKLCVSDLSYGVGGGISPPNVRRRVFQLSPPGSPWHLVAAAAAALRTVAC